MAANEAEWSEMATRALIDTCVWLELLKDYRLQPVLTALEDMASVGELQIVVPDLVREEYERNKDRVVEDSKRSLSSYFKRVREAVEQFGTDDQKRSTVTQLDEISHTVNMKGEVSARALSMIDEMMASGLQLAITDDIKLKAAERALQKRAPFHISKNSMADAVLIETYAALLDMDCDENTQNFFVTMNHRDFGEHNGDKRNPHPDFADLFDGDKSIYSISIVEVIRSLGPDILDHYEFEHAFTEDTRKLSEIIEAHRLLERQIWYNRHWNLRARIDRGEISIVDEIDLTKRPIDQSLISRATWDRALGAAKQTEEEVGLENLGPWDDFEWGMINGKLSALRWIMGEDWDSLDT